LSPAAVVVVHGKTVQVRQMVVAAEPVAFSMELR
jgi:hypothetical protein